MCGLRRDRERRAVYHEPDGVRHLSEDLGGIGGHRRHPATPQDGVEPRLIHWVHSHTHIIGQILPGERQKHNSALSRKGRLPLESFAPFAGICESETFALGNLQYSSITPMSLLSVFLHFNIL